MSHRSTVNAKRKAARMTNNQKSVTNNTASSNGVYFGSKKDAVAKLLSSRKENK